MLRGGWIRALAVRYDLIILWFWRFGTVHFFRASPTFSSNYLIGRFDYWLHEHVSECHLPTPQGFLLAHSHTVEDFPFPMRPVSTIILSGFVWGMSFNIIVCCPWRLPLCFFIITTSSSATIPPCSISVASSCCIFRSVPSWSFCTWLVTVQYMERAVHVRLESRTLVC